MAALDPLLRPMASFVVAIDGPAASGKGTWRAASPTASASPISIPARSIARRPLVVLDAGADPADPAVAAAAAPDRAASAVRPAPRDPRLYDEAVGDAASVVAAIPAVRGALLELQRNFARAPARPGPRRRSRRPRHRHGGLPGGGPEAFLTASAEARARRRVKELRERGAAAIYEHVLQDMKERDARDSDASGRPARQRRPMPSSSIRRGSMPIRFRAGRRPSRALRPPVTGRSSSAGRVYAAAPDMPAARSRHPGGAALQTGSRTRNGSEPDRPEGKFCRAAR